MYELNKNIFWLQYHNCVVGLKKIWYKISAIKQGVDKIVVIAIPFDNNQLVIDVLADEDVSTTVYYAITSSCNHKFINSRICLHKMLDKLLGFNTISMSNRYDYEYLKNWVMKYHKREKQIILLLDFLLGNKLC